MSEKNKNEEFNIHNKNRISAKVIDKVLSRELIEDGSNIIVGFSGGPDSLCLLHVLCQIADSKNLNIFPVHINHNLRGDKSDREEEHAVKICEKFGLECTVYSVDCNEAAEDLGVSCEEAGRIVRYEIFDDMAESLESEGVPGESIAIALAHNADDQSETVLFRLIRGTGTRGLAGIRESRMSSAAYEIIRPLLSVERAEIEEYIKENKLHPNMDESNQVADVTRNKIRLELIPYLEENFNPNIKEALRRYAENAMLDNNLLENVTYQIALEAIDTENYDNAVALDVKSILGQHPAICKRVLGLCLNAMGLEKDTGFELMEELMKVTYSSNPSASLDLPKGFLARREYDKLIFMSKEDLKGPVSIEKYRLFPQIMMKREFSPIKGEVYAAFDFDAFNEKYPGKIGDIKIRTREAGDFIAIADGKSKKLQDYFVDAKIAKSERDSILLAAIGSEVLWILPSSQLPTAKQRENGRFSQNYQIKDTTERVMFLELTEVL